MYSYDIGLIARNVLVDRVQYEHVVLCMFTVYYEDSCAIKLDIGGWILPRNAIVEADGQDRRCQSMETGAEATACSQRETLSDGHIRTTNIRGSEVGRRVNIYGHSLGQTSAFLFPHSFVDAIGRCAFLAR